ncbi:BZIP transcription factor [Musa troglodytarum]|uniref:BZIP transcription factor n=1 Tax=Musa troglodytarum TaxID=320322 RepID=A0A9E7ENX0_9LILI|nr:BZIP transcription factor [Musa troglodytarum]
MADPPPSSSLLLDPPLADLFPDNLSLPSSSDLRDLDLEFDFDDFSVDDFLCSPEESHHHAPSHPSTADGSAVSSSSLNQDPPHAAARPCSPESGDSAASGVFVADRGVKEERGKAGWGLKRKMETDDDGFSDGHADPNLNDPGSNPRSSKFRRSEEPSSPADVGSGGEVVEEKRRARLMRNRESAQLSRQRKKQHVEELEEKVRSMHSTINELNTKVSYIMAENARLRHQLGGNGAPPAVYPPPGAIPPVHFPWIPGYGLRPQGSQFPLVPIPRLKPQQAAPAPKAKKSENKKGDRKTKKVASVSLLGLLFFMLLLGGAIPRVNRWYEGNRVDEGTSKMKSLSQTKGRIFSVRSRDSGPNSTELCSRKKGFGEGGIDRVTGRRCEAGSRVKPMGSTSWSSPGSEAVFTQNSTENLPAMLYVPRNGKHVKINGNLIIHSVLASEKAMRQAKERQSPGEEGKETGLAVAGNSMSALAISKPGREVDQHSRSYRKASNSDDSYVNDLKATLADGPMHQWFREGMAGPILSSGMCTEVFQFDVSPSSSSSSIVPTNSIINASSIVNASENLPPTSSHPRKKRNRRIMYPEPIPLRGTTTANNTEQFEKPSESSNFHDPKPVPSVVVSILADPREAGGDGETDGRISPNSLSRIFVVVLLDSVKYVTYSCVLPFKTSAPHLVN